MTLDEKRVALAEWMGWHLSHSSEVSEFAGMGSRLWHLCLGESSKVVFPWNNFKGKLPNPTLKDCIKELPPLTLDWLHECEKKLFASDNPLMSSPQPSDTYACHLELGVLGRELWPNGESTLEWGDVQKLVHATAEQRLDALLKTIGKL